MLLLLLALQSDRTHGVPSWGSQHVLWAVCSYIAAQLQSKSQTQSYTPWSYLLELQHTPGEEGQCQAHGEGRLQVVCSHTVSELQYCQQLEQLGMMLKLPQALHCLFSESSFDVDMSAVAEHIQQPDA